MKIIIQDRWCSEIRTSAFALGAGAFSHYLYCLLVVQFSQFTEKLNLSSISFFIAGLGFEFRTCSWWENALLLEPRPSPQSFFLLSITSLPLWNFGFFYPFSPLEHGRK
jgi:hypothetical protein